MDKLTKLPSTNPYSIYYTYRVANIDSDKDASSYKFTANFYGAEGYPSISAKFNRMSEAKAWVDRVIENKAKGLTETN